MYRPIITIGDPRADSVNCTKDMFESCILWDRFPKGFYITNLYPRKECFNEALEAMFNEVDRTHLLFRYSAPQPKIELFLIKRGYTRYIDTAGTPSYTNTVIPKSCVVAPRTEEEIAHLTQRAEPFDSESAD